MRPAALLRALARRAGALAVVLAPVLAAGCAGQRARGEPVVVERPAMGTLFRVVAYDPDPARAARAAAAALDRVEALDRALSDYRPDSELMRLCARSDGGAPAEALPVSADLFAVLRAAQELARESGGAFDVTVGPYVRLWRRAARRGELPDEARLAAAGAAVGFGKLELLDEPRAVRLLAADVRLDLGGIAKGYALDEALATLRAHGVERALVDGGGDLAVGAPPPGRAGWRVAVETGAADGVAAGAEGGVELARAGVATSGDAARGTTIGGVRYSHVVDPRTGRALVGGAAATVVAPSATLADALASALCVLAPEEGLALVARHAGVAARIERATAAGRREWRSPGWEALARGAR